MLANRYRIEHEIGKGGMGIVYKGLDKQSGQIVAIKHLKAELTSPELIERFKREGEALRELNHPNIVKMLDAVEEDDNHYLIIEYLAGGDLSGLLKQGQLPLEKVLQIAIDICDALTRAHRLNIIHRDLKPANVLIATDGTPRLTDFGIAHVKGKERVTASDAIIGTVEYLAPEILDGELADPRADIWAFGVMLFEMLAGKRPFTGESIAQTLMAIVTQPVPDLEALCPDAPIALVDLVYRMLEKDPHARIASVRHVGAELEDILEGRTNQPSQMPDTTRFATPTPDFLHRPKHNLPAQTTPFVGREAELTELAKLLDNPKIRLITVVAQGGMGKTRLALELAEQYLTPLQPLSEVSRRGFDNGVYFVELAPLSDHHNIIAAIADATGYQFQGDGRDQKQQILDFLGNKNMLLVMDNYEHLLKGATLVTDILKAAPQVKVLATSRQRLNQSGETVFNLQGMDFPVWETPDDALEYAAVKLFLQGAKRAKPDFEITTDNMDGIARICKLAQGMPLGILLAASWVAMLSPDEIAAEIAKSIDFLESAMSDMPERQRSMRAVFDYSWNLMSEDERTVFMKLSVFRGGFTREAVEVVAGANLRILMSLMNKSLLSRDAEGGRYDIHELLRQYAEAQLQQYGLEDEILDTHYQYYLRTLALQEQDLRGKNQIAALNDMVTDFENIRVAWQRAIEHENHEFINVALDSLTLFFSFRARAEGITFLGQAATHFAALQQPSDELLWARIISRQVVIHLRSDTSISVETREFVNRALMIAEAHDDEIEITFCKTAITFIQLQDRQYHQAILGLEACLPKYEQFGDTVMQAFVLICIGVCYGQVLDADKFFMFTERSLELARKNGDMADVAWTMFNLAWGKLLELGEYDVAVDYSVQCDQIALKVGMYAGQGTLTLGLAAFLIGDFAQAFQFAVNPLKIAQEFQLTSMLNFALGTQTLALFGLEQYENGRKLGETAIIRHANYSVQFNIHWAMALHLIAIGEYEQATSHLQKALKIILMFHNNIYLLYLLPAFAMLTSHQGNHQRAVEFIATAYEHPISYRGWQDAPLLVQFRNDLLLKLGDKYDAAYQHGKTLALDTVLQELVQEFGIEV